MSTCTRIPATPRASGSTGISACEGQPGSNERIVLIEGPSVEIATHIREFSKILQDTRTRPLPYHARHNLRFGQDWNTVPDPRPCHRWVSLLPGILLATSLETPYAEVDGEPVTVESARAFGHDLAQTIRRFLETQQK